jgi:hypothetical protein
MPARRAGMVRFPTKRLRLALHRWQEHALRRRILRQRFDIICTAEAGKSSATACARCVLPDRLLPVKRPNRRGCKHPVAGLKYGFVQIKPMRTIVIQRQLEAPRVRNVSDKGAVIERFKSIIGMERLAARP